jgi:chromosome segregation ATPase
MYYALELIYHNPNDDAIAQLRLDHDALRQDHEALKESLMKSLEKIDKRLKKIRRELSPFGTIQRIQGETSGDIKALAEEVERHQNHVVNQEAELKVLTRKIEELNALIDRIA